MSLDDDASHSTSLCRDQSDQSRELMDARVARKVPASLSLVHRLFHEANSSDRCLLRQSINRVSVFVGHRRNATRTDR